MRYIFAHTLRGREAGHDAAPGQGRRGRRRGSPATGLLRKGAAGYAAEGVPRRRKGPPALFHPPDVGVVCSPPAAAMKEAPGAEQRGKGAYRGRFGTWGAAESKAREARQGSAKGQPGRRFGRKTTAEHPTPGTTRAGGTTKPASFSKGAGFSVPLGRGRP